MMTSNEIRQAFLDFWESKGHKIVPSAPIVIKDDPTLMFTNAGMNQFKDLFLGNKKAEFTRIADTQKCLRVSGKHNDLEEVGVDTYHHTMFEMLGNWSIGDYFKREALEWSWELLTKVYKLDKSRLYVSVFEGDEKENLPQSAVALEVWKSMVEDDHILFGNKKDNFWEMGDTGPCGPCSEIHFDMRSDEERALIPGSELVNKDNPQVIEIWNNVFIQYNRKADGSLEPLPAKHVDTGMGFERLVRVIQGKTSNYDTDVFSHTIDEIARLTGKTYEQSDSKKDIAFRVLSDHIRAISFTIADGQMPSSGGAGYVIRRILRRAVRYYYTYLDTKQPLLHQLVPVIAKQFKNVFPELHDQLSFVAKVILEEEKSFLKTLEAGLKRIEDMPVTDNTISGKAAFELYDTYGFPYDLTSLIASEKGYTIDEAEFKTSLQEQKDRGKADAKKETGDWVQVSSGDKVEFVGYDETGIEDSHALKYRILKQKGQEIYQLVLDKTPFYAEGGGQVGDMGILAIDGEIIKVLDTKKEDGLIIHYVDRIPENIASPVNAEIDAQRRNLIQSNHSATHLLHAALRQVLGTHVQQKGSLVKDDALRFDFAHFQKMSDDEISKVEQIVNQKIRENIALDEKRSIPIAQAKEAGAMMLFGEKYGDEVRMITFDPQYSTELCGGCHVKSTGAIGLFKIVSEAAIAAGVRRIEAVTADGAEAYINDKIEELHKVKSLFKTPNLYKSVHDLQEENKLLKKEMEALIADKANAMQKDLLASAKEVNGTKLITAHITTIDSKNAKNLAYNLLGAMGSGAVVFGLEEGDKVQVMVAVSDDLTKEKNLHAGNMVKALASHIEGNGGGQASFATAGGKKKEGLVTALASVNSLIG
jgi:alanyl-tRNA synthetase